MKTLLGLAAVVFILIIYFNLFTHEHEPTNKYRVSVNGVFREICIGDTYDIYITDYFTTLEFTRRCKNRTCVSGYIMFSSDNTYKVDNIGVYYDKPDQNSQNVPNKE